MNVIVFFIIFWIIWIKIVSKIAVSTWNILNVLKQNDFQKIVKIRTTATKTFYTAIKNGENYLIATIDSAKNPDAKDVEDTSRVMEEIHYHYGILIIKNSCSESIDNYAKNKEIKIIHIIDLIKNGNQDIKVEKNDVIENNNNNNMVNNIEDYQESPIKEVKGNSIISNLFKKPDRL